MRVRLLEVLFVIGAICGCSSSSDSGQNADIIVINALSGVPAVSVVLNDEEIEGNLALGQATEPQSIDVSGEVSTGDGDFTDSRPRVRIYVPGVVTPIIDQRLSLSENERYFYVIGRSGDQARGYIRQEEREPLSDDDSRLIVGNFASDYDDPVDIYVTLPNGTPSLDVVADTVGYGQYSDDIDVPEGVYDVTIREQDGSRIVYQVSSLSFVANETGLLALYDALGRGVNGTFASFDN